MISPCTVCEERFVGCHSECDAYKRWRAEHNKAKKRKDADSLVSWYNRQNSERYLKRVRNKK